MCEICGFEKCPSSCPNYIPPKSYHYCSICNDGITEGEEYIGNDNDEYAHLDCFFGTRYLANWLGYDVKIMEDENE